MVPLVWVFMSFEARDDLEVCVRFVVMSDEGFVSWLVKVKGHFDNTCDWYGEDQANPCHMTMLELLIDTCC